MNWLLWSSYEVVDHWVPSPYNPYNNQSSLGHSQCWSAVIMAALEGATSPPGSIPSIHGDVDAHKLMRSHNFLQGYLIDKSFTVVVLPTWPTEPIFTMMHAVLALPLMLVGGSIPTMLGNGSCLRFEFWQFAQIYSGWIHRGFCPRKLDFTCPMCHGVVGYLQISPEFPWISHQQSKQLEISRTTMFDASLMHFPQTKASLSGEYEQMRLQTK